MSGAAVAGGDQGNVGNAQGGVGKIVKKELSRRERYFWSYTALLLVPLLTGVGFLFFGRTDREMVSKDVDQRVRPVEEELKATRPAIVRLQEGASALVKQQEQLAAVKQKQEDFSGLVTKLNDNLTAVAGTSDLALGNVKRFGDQLNMMRQEQVDISDRISKISYIPPEKLNYLNDSLTAFSRRQDEMKVRLGRLEEGVAANRKANCNDMLQFQRALLILIPSKDRRSLEMPKPASCD